MMREILFRGKRTDNGEWVYGGYYHSTLYDTDECNDYQIIQTFDFYDEDAKFEQVVPETVGQYTEMTEFVMTDKSVNGKLFEGDIVEVWGYRRPKGDNPRSQYDGDFKVRAVIEFKFGEWRLNYDNAYNHSFEKLKGKESDDRVIDGNYKLYRFGYHGSPEHEDWRREHNSHYKWDDIVKIGNIYDSPELLEETK